MSGHVEPSAAHRSAAHWLREMYVALVAEGFTSTEALHVTGVALATVITEAMKGQQE